MYQVVQSSRAHATPWSVSSITSRCRWPALRLRVPSDWPISAWRCIRKRTSMRSTAAVRSATWERSAHILYLWPATLPRQSDHESVADRVRWRPGRERPPCWIHGRKYIIAERDCRDEYDRQEHYAKHIQPSDPHTLMPHPRGLRAEEPTRRRRTSSHHYQTAGARTGGTLRVGQSATDVGTVDPDYASGTPGSSTGRHGLQRPAPLQARRRKGSSRIWPRSCRANHQRRRQAGLDIRLRSGVMCHPSDDVPAYELTSEDVVYSLQKAANKDTSAYASDYAGMTFARRDPNGQGHARQAAVDRAVLPTRGQLLGRLHLSTRLPRSSARTDSRPTRWAPGRSCSRATAQKRRWTWSPTTPTSAEAAVGWHRVSLHGGSEQPRARLA